MTQYPLQPLEYAYDSLEPHFDGKTMVLHHRKHLLAYLTNLNAMIQKYGLANLPARASQLVAGIRFLAVNGTDLDKFIFNAGGVANHEFFFSLLRGGERGAVPGDLERAINGNFGTVADFCQLFKETALSLRGSGWTWLCVNPAAKKRLLDGVAIPELFICNTQNHDNPSMIDVTQEFGLPVLCLDLWEHSHYLKFQNRKGEYVDAFWSVLNWEKAAENYHNALIERF